MSQEAAMTFLGSIDEGAVNAAKESDDAVAALVQAGAAAGHAFTADDLKAAGAQIKQALSEAQLDQVAGGVPGTAPLSRDGDGIQVPSTAPLGNLTGELAGQLSEMITPPSAGLEPQPDWPGT